MEESCVSEKILRINNTRRRKYEEPRCTYVKICNNKNHNPHRCMKYAGHGPNTKHTSEDFEC